MRVRVELFLKAVANAGLKILITETWRSQERQEYLYASGRTRPGNVVTWTMYSKHLIGEAVDIAFLTDDGKVTYSGNWEAVGRLGELQGLVWGGRWPTPDRPHFEFNHQWQAQHWGAQAEQELLSAGAITQKKNLDQPPSRAELYVILSHFHKL